MEKIGTLIIEVYGELKSKESIDVLQRSLGPALLQICDTFDFDFKRFGYFAANLIWVVPLKEFWRNDQIYNILKFTLEEHFLNWKFTMTLLIKEKGD